MSTKVHRSEGKFYIPHFLFVVSVGSETTATCQTRHCVRGTSMPNRWLRPRVRVQGPHIVAIQRANSLRNLARLMRWSRTDYMRHRAAVLRDVRQRRGVFGARSQRWNQRFRDVYIATTMHFHQ